jgi:hypothetical protein
VRIPQQCLPLDATPGAPWVIVPRDVRRAFDALRDSGPPLWESPFGRPTLGVKCGCNAAFLIRPTAWTDDVVSAEGLDGRVGCVERSVVRPVLRGEDVRPWCAEPRLSLLWTHDAAGHPLDALPPRTRAWLTPWRRTLAARADARQSARWWTLFRTEAARCVGPRVVWADVGHTLRAVVVEAGDPIVPLNTCYVLFPPSMEDAYALTALLNSPLATAWLRVLAEPARGGYRRFLGWTVAMLPLPRDWTSARAVLSTIGRRGATSDDADVLAAVLDAYSMSRRDVAALLAWSGG